MDDSFLSAEPELPEKARHVPVGMVRRDLACLNAKERRKRNLYGSTGCWNATAVGQRHRSGVFADPEALQDDVLSGRHRMSNLEPVVRKCLGIPSEHLPDTFRSGHGARGRGEVSSWPEEAHSFFDLSFPNGFEILLGDYARVVHGCSPCWWLLTIGL